MIDADPNSMVKVDSRELEVASVSASTLRKFRYASVGAAVALSWVFSSSSSPVQEKFHQWMDGVEASPAYAKGVALVGGQMDRMFSSISGGVGEIMKAWMDARDEDSLGAVFEQTFETEGFLEEEQEPAVIFNVVTAEEMQALIAKNNALVLENDTLASSIAANTAAAREGDEAFSLWVGRYGDWVDEIVLWLDEHPDATPKERSDWESTHLVPDPNF